MLTLRKLLNGVNLTTCDASLNSNSGCDVTEWSMASYGPLFEASGGGVIAMKWDENSISVCECHLTLYLFNAILYKGYIGSFFRVGVPDDINQGTPNPSAWGAPSATLSNTSCNIEQYFVNHSIVFGKCNLFSILFISNYPPSPDITFCGMYLIFEWWLFLFDDLTYRWLGWSVLCYIRMPRDMPWETHGWSKLCGKTKKNTF